MLSGRFGNFSRLHTRLTQYIRLKNLTRSILKLMKFKKFKVDVPEILRLNEKFKIFSSVLNGLVVLKYSVHKFDRKMK